MRIVQLIPSLQVGGAEKVAALLAEELVVLGHRVEVVSLAGESGSFLEAGLRDRPGIGLHFLGKGPGFEPRVIARLARLLRRLRPDVVHSHLHTLKYLLPARALSPRLPVVHTLHNLAEHEAVAADRRLQQLAFRIGVAPVAIGDAVADSVRRVYGLDPAAVIPNGIPVAAQRAPAGSRERIRAELGLPADALVLLFAGRLNPQKDPLRLVEALAAPELAARNLRLLIAGEGELREALEARIAERGLQERVQLLGVRRDVPALLAAADAFVLPSRYEGNPLVVMEAMSAGRAVVASAVGCVPELVSAETGRLVPAEDVAPLVDALSALTAAPDRLAAMGREGARVAETRFDTPVMARAYADLYARRGHR
ncbi:MAG: glycosyltransferase [Alphaproteobacteria bacterium]|nr:glycosyltransferase [Alphaproteobacteria bacterium]